MTVVGSITTQRVSEFPFRRSLIVRDVRAAPSTRPGNSITCTDGPLREALKSATLPLPKPSTHTV